MTGETQNIVSGGTFATEWKYNSADLPTSMTYPGDGEKVAFDYNDRMLLSQVRNTNGTPDILGDDYSYVASTLYDSAGRIELRTFGNNSIQTDYEYYDWDTQGGRLKYLQSGTPGNTASLQNLDYSYDPAGNITQIMNSLPVGNEKQVFRYDSLDRLRCWGLLTDLNGTSGCESYNESNDTFGPLTSADEEYRYASATGNLDIKAGVDLNYNDTTHRHAVTHIGTDQKYWYDANGNQIKRIAGPDTYDLLYDAENRLSQVKKNNTVIASFTYDGDGNRVKNVMGSETTVFIGGYFEVTGSTITKYYFAGGQRVAMRKYLIPQYDTLTYLLGDHLGSTSLAVDASDTDFSDVVETRYKPWGEVRFTTPNKTLPTRYTYTGQYSHVNDDATDLGSAGFGLLFYNARWYDPSMGRFAQADTIVPGGVQGLDRYAYVNNSPMNFTDPSGHQCVPIEECELPDLPEQSDPPPLVIFSNDDGQSFTPEEKDVLEAGVLAVARALARTINAPCTVEDRKMGDCRLLNPQEALYEVFGGPISVKRVTGTCSNCWARHKNKNADGYYEIWIYSSTSVKEILDHPRLIIHEVGHAFYWSAGGYIEGSSVGERNGFYGPHYQWQFGQDSKGDYGTEIFADMFLGWVYGKWEMRNGTITDNGQAKSAYMDKYMPLMINMATGR